MNEMSIVHVPATDWMHPVLINTMPSKTTSRLRRTSSLCAGCIQLASTHADLPALPCPAVSVGTLVPTYLNPFVRTAEGDDSTTQNPNAFLGAACTVWMVHSHIGLRVSAWCRPYEGRWPRGTSVRASARSECRVLVCDVVLPAYPPCLHPMQL